ncbi:MAG: penicillin acylase family protein [Candidatus Nezhaarchaeales archaeon]
MKKKEVVGLVASLALMILLLIPYPIPLSPYRLLTLTDPASGVWVNAVIAKLPAEKKVVMPGLTSQVIIVIDRYGVPHIFADSDKDLAFAIGYMHANDRLWQMDLQRRLVEGRLSEIFGSIAYDVDVFQRIIGLHRGAEACLQLIKAKHPELYELLEAYCSGVNKAIEEMKAGKGLPVEFKLLGYEPEPWTPLNVFEIARLIAWGLTGTFADIELYLLYSRLGDKVWELIPLDRYLETYIVKPGYKVIIGNYSELAGRRVALPVHMNSEDVMSILEWKRSVDAWMPPIIDAFASNNWVISGALTDTGKPILCNDPHLQLTVPPVWYELHYTVRSGGELFIVRGVTFPGIPLVVIGSNQYVGWGFTNVMADQIDFYYYEWANETHYWYKGELRKIDQRKEVIKVKTDGGYEERLIYINFTVHGPLIERGGARFAMRWIGHEGTTEAVAIWKYSRARNISEFFDAMNYFQTPPQNHVVADIYGNIGWRACGRYPNRTYPNGTNAVALNPLLPRLPINGSALDVVEWNEEDWIEPWEAPQLLNPPWGYVVTANNKLASVGDYPLIYDVAWTFADYYRAFRITERIEDIIRSGRKITMNDMRSIQNDVQFVLARNLTQLLVSVADEEIRSILKAWNYEMSIDSPAAAIFITWYKYFKMYTFIDELEEKGLRDYWDRVPDSTLEYLVLYNPKSKWFDDVTTKGLVEDAVDIAKRALNATIEELKGIFKTDDPHKWRLGELHKLRAEHQLGTVFRGLSYPAWEAPGWSDCVNNIAKGGGHGPSWRMILNFANLNDSLCVIPGGQSGNPFSEWYYDQLKMWLDGEYKAMRFPAKSEDVKDAVCRIILTPTG